MLPKRTHAPDREHIPTLQSLGIVLDPETAYYVEDSEALANSLGGNGLEDVFANRIVFVAAFSACMGGLLFGFDQRILSISLTMPQFLEQFPETDGKVTSSAAFNKGIMTALLELGAFLGAIMMWFIIGSTIQASSYGFVQLVVGRFIGGIGVGVLSSTAPMYISEIAPPNIRGAFLVLEASSIVIGIVIMFYITYGTRHMPDDWSFRLPFTIQMAPSGETATRSLTRLRRLPASDARLQAEWITIRAEAIRNRETVIHDHPTLTETAKEESFMGELKLEAVAWMDMFRPGIHPRAPSSLIYYSPSLFEHLGLDYEMQITTSSVLNVCQMVATCSAFVFLDRVGRKPPLLVGSFMNAVSHFIVPAMIGKYSSNWEAHPQQAWVGVGFILVFMFCFGLGWSPVPWALRHGYGTFIFFGVWSVLSGIWTWFLCPETKGKTLEDIDSLFHSHAAYDEVEAKKDIVHAIINGAGAPRGSSTQSVLYDKDPKSHGEQVWVQEVA